MDNYYIFASNYKNRFEPWTNGKSYWTKDDYDRIIKNINILRLSILNFNFSNNINLEKYSNTDYINFNTAWFCVEDYNALAQNINTLYNLYDSENSNPCKCDYKKYDFFPGAAELNKLENSLQFVHDHIVQYVNDHFELEYWTDSENNNVQWKSGVTGKEDPNLEFFVKKKEGVVA